MNSKKQKTETIKETAIVGNALLADAEIKNEWDIRKCFEQLRFEESHLGMGDIRLTMGMQEEICELVERFYLRR